MTNPIALTLHFHGWLQELVKRAKRSEELPCLSLTRRTSVKDLIESFGVPHTEVGSIEVDQKNVSFAHIVQNPCSIDVYPLIPPVNVLAPSGLRPEPLSSIRFLVDVNVARLSGKLRMAGFDTLYDSRWDDDDLAALAEQRKCILLTRDIMLLKRTKITFGHLVREVQPQKQLAEIISFYGLYDQIRPFTRCMRCNGLLAPVAKEDILQQLEPLTRKYYQTFHRCTSCSQIYWSGSHRDAMVEGLKELRAYGGPFYM